MAPETHFDAELIDREIQIAATLRRVTGMSKEEVVGMVRWYQALPEDIHEEIDTEVAVRINDVPDESDRLREFGTLDVDAIHYVVLSRLFAELCAPEGR